jgi:ATP-dependent Clp protease protease subunit
MPSEQIFLTGYVDEWMSKELMSSLKKSKEKEVDIFISSYGGSVDEGFTIANYIQGLNKSGTKEIHTHNLSHADSIATILMLAAPKENRHIVESSTMFLHDPLFSVFLANIKQEDARKMDKELEIQKNRVADFYVKNIEGLEKDEALALMSGEVTLTAKQMLDLGIVSEVKESFKIAANKVITNNNRKMGLFGRKNDEPINTTTFVDGTQIAYSGELKEGIEIQKIGENTDLNGEFITEDNRKVIIENNKVSGIEVIENSNDESLTLDIVAQAIANALDPLSKRLEELETTIDNLRNTPSNGKIPAVPVNQTQNLHIGTQESAKKAVNDLNKRIANKRKEE